MTEAACAGKWRLFDSTDHEDHREAFAICMSCPLLESCREQRDQVLREAGPAGRPEGTWAGRLLLDRGKPTWTNTPKHRKASDVDEAVVARWFSGENLPTTRAEREVITQRWFARGGGWKQLERRGGWKPERYLKTSEEVAS